MLALAPSLLYSQVAQRDTVSTADSTSSCTKTDQQYIPLHHCITNESSAFQVVRSKWDIFQVVCGQVGLPKCYKEHHFEQELRCPNCWVAVTRVSLMKHYHQTLMLAACRSALNPPAFSLAHSALLCCWSCCLDRYDKVISACAMSFAHGANDVANSIGSFAAAYYTYQTGRVPGSNASSSTAWLGCCVMTTCRSSVAMPIKLKWP